MEILDQAELLENQAGGWSPLSGGRGFTASQNGKGFLDAGVYGGLPMAAAQVNSAIFLDQLIHLGSRVLRKNAGEDFDQVEADVAFQKFERHVRPATACK